MPGAFLCGLRHPLVSRVLLPWVLLSIIAVSTPVTERAQGFDSDGKRYGAMADQSLFKSRYRHEAPWCWRVVTPFLASLLPFETLTNFRVLAFVSNWLSLVFLFGILRRSGFSPLLCQLGVLLYAGVFWSAKFFFYSPAYIDSGTQALLLAIVYLALRKATRGIPLLLAVGVLQKESLLFLAPVVWVDYARARGWSAKSTIGYGAALLAFPVFALIAVRTGIPATNDYSAFEMIRSQAARLATLDFWPRLGLAAFSGLGILPLVVALGPATARDALSRRPLWWVLASIAVLFLVFGEDKARLFLYLLPALVVAALQVIQTHVLHRWLDGVARVRAWAWIAVILALHLYLGHHFTGMGRFDDYLDRMVPMYASDDAITGGLVRVAVVVVLFGAATALLLRRPASFRA